MKMLRYRERQKYPAPAPSETEESPAPAPPPPVKEVPLYGAWAAYPEPKPSLPVVLRLILDKEIRGTFDETTNIAHVDPRHFSDDLTLWIEISEWKEVGRFRAPDLEDGHHYVLDYVRGHLATEDAFHAGLLCRDGKRKNPKFTWQAQAELRAGAIPTAYRGTRQRWAAPEEDILAWIVHWGFEEEPDGEGG